MRTTPRPARPGVRRRLAVAAVAAPLALVPAACGGGTETLDGTGNESVDDNGADNGASLSPSASPSAPATSEAAPSTPAAPASTPAAPPVGGPIAAVAQTALGAAGGTIFTIDRDDDGGWEVSVVSVDATVQEVDVSADGATVTGGPRSGDDGDSDGDSDSDDRAERARLLAVPIDWSAAVQAALGAVPGATVTGVDLDEGDDRDVATWEVQLGEDTPQETTVEVDATTGAVLRTEREDGGGSAGS